MSNIKEIKEIDFPLFKDPRGSLSVIESHRHIPFDIKRIYYINNVPQNESRAAHAHKELQQIFIAVNGSFNVVFDDGLEKKTFHLNTSSKGIYIPSMIWRVLYNFSSDAVCLVLASRHYEEDDYIHSYEDFLMHPRSRKKSLVLEIA